MNPKEIDTNKKVIRNNTSTSNNGGQHIFVLSPNLLQKLGINLGNVGSPHSIPGLEQKITDKTYIRNSKQGNIYSNTTIPEANDNDKIDDSSITKTASLMRESVFLSPTFNSSSLKQICNVTRVDEGIYNPQIYNTIDECGTEKIENNLNKKCIPSSEIECVVQQDYNKKPENHRIIDGGLLIENDNFQTNNTEIKYTIDECKSDKIEKELNNGHYIPCDIPPDDLVNKCYNSKIDKKINAKINDDSLLLKNDKLQINANGFSSLDNVILQKELKKTINIISEETLTISELNELNFLQIPQKNSMLPASLNTVIMKKTEIKNSVSQNQNSSFTEGIVDIDCSNMTFDGISENIIHSTVDSSRKTYESKYLIENESSEHVDLNISQKDCNIQPLLSGDFCNKDLNSSIEIGKISTPESYDDINEKNEKAVPVDQNLTSSFFTTSKSKQKELAMCSDNDLKENVNIEILDDKIKIREDAMEGMEFCLTDTININNNKLKQTDPENCHDKKLVSKIMYVDDDTLNKNCEHKTINNIILKKLKSGASNVTVVDQMNMECELGRYTEVANGFLEKAFEKDIQCKVQLDYEFTESPNSNRNIVIGDGMNSGISLPLHDTRNNSISKLCIQGVEKPGGPNIKDAQITVSFKTYSRNKVNKCYESMTFPNKKNIADNKKSFEPKRDIDIQDENTVKITNNQQFCICYDFGILTYDNDETSEHIHFMKKSNVNCSPDIIFSIYNNGEITHSDWDSEIPVTIKENTDEMELDSICWNHALAVSVDSDTKENIQKIPTSSPLYSENSNSLGKNNFPRNVNHDSYKNNIVNPVETLTWKNLEPDLEDKNTEYTVFGEVTCGSEKRMDEKDNSIYNGDAKMNIDSRTRELDVKNVSKKRKISENYNEGPLSKKEKCAMNVEVCRDELAERGAEDNVPDQCDKALKEKSHDTFIEEKSSMKQLDNTCVRCAVCNVVIRNTDWYLHIATRHNYLAWREGETSVDLQNEDAIKEHLERIVEEFGKLVCFRCGLIRKRPKIFLQHTKICDTSRNSPNTTLDEAVEDDDATEIAGGGGDLSRARLVKCGVCKEEVESEQWLAHIQRQHNYCAWREGEPPLEFEDEKCIRDHLYHILHEFGPLVCSKCGVSRKYVKVYLQHIESCTGPKEPSEPINPVRVALQSMLERAVAGDGVGAEKVKCGMCKEEVALRCWIDHTQKEHNYLSWQDGDAPLDLTNEEEIRRYLHVIVQKLGSLVCGKCGIVRKYARAYLSHIDQCTGPLEDSGKRTPVKVRRSSDVHKHVNGDGSSVQEKREVCKQNMELKRGNDDKQICNDNPASQEDQAPLVHVNSTVNEGEVKCAVCQKVVNESDWLEHILRNHDYIAWKDTEEPIDISSYESIRKHLAQIIKDVGALNCPGCGAMRKYPKSYLLHLNACCGKTYAVVDAATSALSERRTSDSDAIVNQSYDDEDEDNGGSRLVRCGVCGKRMEARLWIAHIQKLHNYVAWLAGDAPVDLENEASIITHLEKIVKKAGRLTCAKCGQLRRKVSQFYEHTKTCEGSMGILDENIETVPYEMDTEYSGSLVKCAVCQSEVQDSLWIEHIATEHGYIAWKEGEEPLDKEDEVAVCRRLYEMVQHTGKLICNQCGITRKYPKSYLQHVKVCTGSKKKVNYKFAMKVTKERGDIVTCAVCRAQLDDTEWVQHIAAEHDYLAWRDRDPTVNVENEEEVRNHLKNIIQEEGYLKCSKCGLQRKYPKVYLQHVKFCDGTVPENMEVNDSINESGVPVDEESDLNDTSEAGSVKCGVCAQEVRRAQWHEHIRKEHQYLAWRDGDEPLNLEDDDEVRSHLKNIIQETGYLKCLKCGLQRKYAKVYLQHVKTCDGKVPENMEVNDSINESGVPDDEESDLNDTSEAGSVKCGVCAQEVRRAQWHEHIRKEHQYLAWRDGDEPLDINDKEAVYAHLHEIKLRYKRLVCGACGRALRYVKTYLQHVQACSSCAPLTSAETIKCGVCGKEMKGAEWRAHAIREHYNVAWIDGDDPLEVRSYYGVERYLKEYLAFKNKLVCKVCGASRVSLAGFYAHVIVCGKSEEEADSWKDVCSICNQKYLCIYENQHYQTHKAQQLAKARKLQPAAELDVTPDAAPAAADRAPARRRAAEKARSVIGEYASNFSTGTKYKCGSCGFGTDNKEELSAHRCAPRPDEPYEDSDDSIRMDDYSEDESDDSDVDSNVSNEESDAGHSRKHKSDHNTSGSKHLVKNLKFPVIVKDVRPYMQESRKDFFKMLYTRERLFGHWQDCSYEAVSNELKHQYMPPLEESCKVKISTCEWITYKRFEANKEKGCSVVFTGASIQCLAWVPVHPDHTPECRNILAVVCHRGPDCPRLFCTDTSEHPALIQLWDFGNFKTAPKLAFGLAHDYGTIWAIDWCPSGARDMVLSGPAQTETSRPRLGLLAMACSNGSAYIVPVPHPDKDQTGDIPFYKLRPCVELRLTRGKRKYQATSINWSLVEGYTTITVGYADGTVASYDLATESPLLTARDGELDVLYPFQDERLHNSCVTGLASCIEGAWCSASVTGATACVGAAGAPHGGGWGVRPLRSHLPLSATGALFTPLWPSVLLSGDDTIGLSVNELEWGSVGRRFGSARAFSACAHSGHVAAAVPPLLQLVRPHPAFTMGNKAVIKKTVGILEMAPLQKKRSKQANDELTMKLEPIKYEDAIMSYGIELKLEKDLDKAAVQKLQLRSRLPYPERFPLADVPALAHCPAAAHHARLAVATHAGLLFLISV